MRKTLVLALLLFAALGAQYLTWRSRSGVAVVTEQIAGNPVDRYTAQSGTPGGVVIVAHGFAANKRMMSEWGYYFAREGFDTYVLDEPGHGESSRPLPNWQARGNTALGDNLRAVIDQLVGDGRAKPGRIALIGHSMGGSAVTTEALTDDRVAATVAISSAYTQPLPADRPHNLLSLAAERDPSSMVKAVEAIAAQSNDGKGELDKQYGYFNEGGARESGIIAGKNHLTIIYDTDVMYLAAQWVGAAFAMPVHPLTVSWLWVLVALIGALGVVVAVAALVAPQEHSREKNPAQVTLLTGVVTLAVAAFSAVLAVVYLRFPWPRLAVVDYQLPYFLVMAIVLLVLRFLWPREFGFSLAPAFETALVDLVRGVAIFLGYIGAVGTVIQMNLSDYTLIGRRIVPMLVIAAVLWLYLVQEEGLKRAVAAYHGPLAAVFLGFIGKALIIGTWLAGAALPNPQSFLSLTIPVVVVLFAVMEALSALFAAWRFSAISTATFTALVLAWSVAATFPLV